MNKIINQVVNFFNQLTTTEITLISILAVAILFLIYLTLRIKKLSYNYYAKSVSKTIENQTKEIAELQKQVSLYKREDTGIIAQWVEAREDKSAYMINIYNDSAERIFNLEVRIEAPYDKFSKLFWKKDNLWCLKNQQEEE